MLDIIENKIDDILSLLENVGYFLINEQQKHEYKTYKKKDGSLLTDLDIASEVIIKNELNSLFGDVKILSEENTFEENVNIAKEKYFFLLDPIDGTASFTKGGDFTINLAFCVDKKPVVGFIHNPSKGVIICGNEHRAFKKQSGKIIKLEKLISPDKYDRIIDNNQPPLRVVIGKHCFNDKEFVDCLVEEIRKYGYNFSKYSIKQASAMGKLLAFINNDTDCFLTANVCKSWDILPAVPILTAINGYNNMQNKYVYENNTFHCGSFIVANNEELLSDLMEISTKLPHKFISEINV